MICDCLTIIVPNYNKCDFLEDCINSIFTQTLIPKQVIVVDDKSTDDSLLILNKLKEKYNNLLIIPLQENKGVSNARNAGILACQTKYVSFLDSDDFIFNPRKIENEMRLMKNSTNKLIYSNYIKVNENGGVLEPNKKYYNFLNLRGMCFGKIQSVNSLVYGPFNFIVATDLVKRVGCYSFPLNLYEDYDLLIRLSKVCRFVPTNEIGYAYRFTPNGLSKAKLEEHKKALAIIKNTYYQHPSFGHKIQWFFRRVLLKIFRNKI